MNVKSLIVLLAMTCVLPAYAKAQEAPVEQKPASSDAQQVGEQKPKTPTLEEVAAKVEKLDEAVNKSSKSIDLFSKLKVSGYLQAQYVDDERSRDELTGSGGTRNHDQFSVRRGRVKFTYQMSPTSRFVLQPDITSSGVTLKDGYLELTEPWTGWKNTLTAGQFNWPFGFEIAYSSSSRELPERSRVVRTLFPGERDRGVMLSGHDPSKRFRYQVAVVNGTGTTRSDDLNQRKDLTGRVGYSFGSVDVGASLYRGSDLVATSTNASGAEFDKERQGIDIQWKTPLRGLAMRGEFISGKQAPSSGTTRDDSYDVAGWYLYAIQNVGTRHQFAVRVDEYDGNTDAAGDSIRTVGGSYIFHWDKHSKMMLAYEHPEAETNDPADDVMTLRYQFSF